MQFPFRRLLCGMLLIAASAERACARDAQSQDPPASVSEVVTGLDNPCGLAIRPGGNDERYEVFVSDSAAGRVVRLSSDQPQNLSDVVTGFPLSTFGDETSYKIGPLGLLFLSRHRLVVGGGGQEAGAELIRIYELPDDGSPLQVDQMQQSLGPIAAGDESASGEHDFYALAASDDYLFATSRGDHAKGWVLRAGRQGEPLGELKPFIATREASGTATPVAATVNPRSEKRYLVVSQTGSLDEPADSRLTFYNPHSGELVLNLPTELNDIVALAYSPKTGLLYAADFSWIDPSQGGVYRLDAALVAGQQSVRAVPIASVLRPTALAFAPDGALYVTSLGDTDGTQSGQGVLLKLTSDSQTPW